MGRRSRSRGGGNHVRRVAVLALAVLVVFGVGAPATSFTVGSVDRASSIDIVGDTDGILTLDVATNVTVGTEDDLVTVTDYTGRNVTVTVSLVNGSDEADLVLDGTNVGDSTSFDLTPEESQLVNVSVGCTDSMPDGNVYFRVRAEGEQFEGVANRSSDVVGSCGPGAAFFNTSSSTLATVDGNSYAEYGVSDTVAVGPAEHDLDGDGRVEVPYVQSDGDVYIVDEAGEKQRLVAGDAPTGKARLAVGKWNGSALSVFYANASDNSYIYRVAVGSDPVKVSPEAKADAVGGIADIDVGDEAKELVFAGTSQTVKYLDDDGTVDSTGQGVGSNSGGIGLGEPHDFDGDGIAKIPIVDGSNNVDLLTADGTTTNVASGAEKAALATVNWDGGTDQEIVFIESSSDELRYITLTASLSGTVHAPDGGPYPADIDTGTA